MGFLKGLAIKEGRYPIRFGLDLSVCEAGPRSTIGTAIKFRSGATLGYNATAGEWEKGVLFRETLSEGIQANGGEYKGKYGTGFRIAIDTTNEEGGHPQGGLYVTFDRISAYPHSGGAQDCALRVIGTNRAVCSSGGVRGMDIMAYCQAEMGSVHGALITAKVKSSGSGTGSGTDSIYGARIVSKCQAASGGFSSMHALEVADESDGVVCSENSILWIEKQSNSYQANSKAGLEIVNNSLTTYAKDITHAIYLKSGASGAQFTYVFGFDSENGDEGFTSGSFSTQSGNIIGYIKLRNVDGSADLFMPMYNQAPA